PPLTALRPSSAAAAHHHHVLIVLEHHIVHLVHVQHGDGAELRGHAARLGHRGRVHRVHERLHDGVVRAVQVVADRERAVPLAVVGVVAGRSHDPVLPAHVGEVHEQRAALAHVARLLAAVRAVRAARGA
ncbi:unnamed protein product, partial [Plutella xylostella]